MFGVWDRRSRDVGGGHAQVREPLPRLANWGVSRHAGSHRIPSSVDPKPLIFRPGNPTPKTRNPRPETRNPRPEIRDPKRFREVSGEGGRFSRAAAMRESCGASAVDAKAAVFSLPTLRLSKISLCQKSTSSHSASQNVNPIRC